jgi:undecaprenyl-diphosphatase
MTVANDVERDPGAAAPAAAWRRCATNVGTALTLLVRPPRIHPQESWLTRRQLAIAAAVIAVVLLLGMSFVDAPMIHAARRLPRWVVSFFDAITDYGKSGWVLWPLGLLFLLLAALPPVLPRFARCVLAAIMVRVGFLFVAVAVPGLFVTTVKRMIGRARPVVNGGGDPFAFSPFIWRADHASLPSGHSTTAFAILVAFGTLWPRGRPLLVLYALMIAMSRIVVTAHYPTDVLAGAVVGTVGALMVRRWFALRGLGFSVGPDGVLHQYPGPSDKRIKAVARDLLAP